MKRRFDLSPESDVGDALGNMDLAEQRSIRIIGVDTIAGARPYPAFAVDAKTIKQT